MNVEHGGNIYEYEKELIDFSSNINPLGPPAEVQKVLDGGCKDIERYPDRDYSRLHQKLADHHDVSRDMILPGNGAAEIIYLLGKLLEKSRVLIPVPTFSEYAHVVRINEGVPVFLKRPHSAGLSPPLASLKKYEDIDAIFLCRPNNPGGSLQPRSDLEEVLEMGALIIADESFLDFLPREEEETLIEHLPRRDNLIVLRSSTKFYALPGLRLGYALASPAIIEKLSAHQPPWSINALAAEVGRRLPELAGFRHSTHTWLQKERDYLEKNLEKMGWLELYPGEANFILLGLKEKKFTAAELKEEMVEEGILIRDCASFRGLDEYHFRLAVKGRNDNKKLLSALETVRSRLKGS